MLSESPSSSPFRFSGKPPHEPPFARSSAGVIPKPSPPPIGLGRTALMPVPPPRAQSPHSLKKLLGLGKSSLLIYLDGSALTGVSMPSPVPCLAPARPSPPLSRFASYASLFCVDVGGGGRANGFPGPTAPADNTADALGEGGGSTMCRFSPRSELLLELPAGLALRGCAAEADGASGPPEFSLSEASEGMVRFNFGRAPLRDPLVFDLCGGGKSFEAELGRGGCCMGWASLG